jgi:hypothetical protein
MNVRWRQGATLLFVLALAALVAEGASLPHVHDDPGWHDQEHDLAYLVALAAAGVPAAVTAAPRPLGSARGVRLPAGPRSRTAPWRHRASRAPPAS